MKVDSVTKEYMWCLLFPFPFFIRFFSFFFFFSFSFFLWISFSLSVVASNNFNYKTKTKTKKNHSSTTTTGTYPEVAAQLSNAHEERLCSTLEVSAHAGACRDVAQVYGLENVAPIAHAAPDLLCEQLRECARPGEHQNTLPASAGAAVATSSTSAAAARRRMTREQATAVLGDVLISSEPSPGGGVSKGVMSMMSSLFKMRMQSQMMMQAMQMRQQLMENEHKMMQKVMRAMARNRAIRAELKHLKKMAYREQPGNCDCCDGCLPPAKGGKKH
jgi:hypothetical protein